MRTKVCIGIAISAAVATGVTATPGLAAVGTELVQGTTLASLSLSAGTGASFSTGFTTGGTATSSGALTATDTSLSWTLQVKDTASSNPGHMAAAASGCSGSDASLANPLSVQVTSPLGGVTSAGSVSISGTNQTVASATSQLLAANVFTTNYTQVIPSTEVLRTGCVYSLTATYTLQ